MATSWTTAERTAGRLLKEDGGRLLLEDSFDIIIDYITDFTSRIIPSNLWDMLDGRIGPTWPQLDDAWSDEVRTWAELGQTAYTIRTKP